MKNESGLSPKNKPRWYKYLNPIFSDINQGVELAAESADVSCMNNFGEDPRNESYPESEVSNFSDDEGSNFSASLSSKSKVVKEKIKKHSRIRGRICGALRDLVPFVQFKKREKYP